MDHEQNSAKKFDSYLPPSSKLALALSSSLPVPAVIVICSLDFTKFPAKTK